MKYMKNPLLWTLLLVLLILWVSVNYLNLNNQNKILKMDLERVTNEKDSIQSELFNESVMSGRYELTFEYLKEIDKESYDKCEKHLEHETE